MTSPLPLPDWIPWWVHLAILLALLFVVVMVVLMPFSVFGTKSRLEAIEIRLDEIQAEIRSLALRLPDQEFTDDISIMQPRDRYRSPPIPPAPVTARQSSKSSTRTEPRLY